VDSGSLFHFFAIAKWGIFGHLLAFLIQMQRLICTILGEMTDANKIMHSQHFGTDPTDGYGLIRKSGFESRITFVSNFGVGGGLRSLKAFVSYSS